MSESIESIISAVNESFQKITGITQEIKARSKNVTQIISLIRDIEEIKITRENYNNYPFPDYLHKYLDGYKKINYYKMNLMHKNLFTEYSLERNEIFPVFDSDNENFHVFILMTKK